MSTSSRLTSSSTTSVSSTTSLRMRTSSLTTGRFSTTSSSVRGTLTSSSPRFERRFTLYEEGDTTRIRDQWKLDTGRPAVLERLARGRLKSAVAENLAKLKELLEEGRGVFQD